MFFRVLVVILALSTYSFSYANEQDDYDDEIYVITEINRWDNRIKSGNLECKIRNKILGAASANEQKLAHWRNGEKIKIDKLERFSSGNMSVDSLNMLNGTTCYEYRITNMNNNESYIFVCGDFNCLMLIQ